MSYLYHNRILRQQQRRLIQETKTLRDAIVIQLYESQNYCTVKIQGTNELITAYYNQSWTSRPAWLTQGNVVRIETPEGNSGRVQVSGHGFSMPIPIPGGDITPEKPIGPDAVLSGMLLHASNVVSPHPDHMQASVDIGTYRIGGVIYTLSQMTMDEAIIYFSRKDVVLGRTAGSVAFDDSSSTLYRVDTVSVGTDGVLTVTKGTASSGEPAKEDVPSNHVLIGYVSINPGATFIADWNINQLWVSEVPVRLEIVDTSSPATPTPFRLPWLTETCTGTVEVLDQNGNSLLGAYSLRVTFAPDSLESNGTFIVDGRPVVNGDVIVVINTGVVNFSYTRITPAPSTSAVSPFIQFLEQNYTLIGAQFIVLEDSSGDIMV